MRTEKEMLDMILETADADARIRAVTMEGSRANPNAVHDEYSDFDITFFVTDVREFTRDKEWIHRLGDILIVQCPTDWYSHPYDYSSRDPFAFLIQFADGNRIDLTLRDVGLISGEAENKEPRIVLLNKDNFPSLLPIESEEAFFFSAARRNGVLQYLQRIPLAVSVCGQGSVSEGAVLLQACLRCAGYAHVS